MVASSISELHEFAELIGIKRCWYENKGGKKNPHYDIKGESITKAIENGAILVTRKELLMFLREHY